MKKSKEVLLATTDAGGKKWEVVLLTFEGDKYQLSVQYEGQIVFVKLPSDQNDNTITYIKDLVRILTSTE